MKGRMRAMQESVCQPRLELLIVGFFMGIVASYGLSGALQSFFSKKGN